MNKLLWVIFAQCLFLISCSGIKQTKDEERYLVVLSLDGFRWDYTNLTTTQIWIL